MVNQKCEAWGKIEKENEKLFYTFNLDFEFPSLEKIEFFLQETREIVPIEFHLLFDQMKENVASLDTKTKQDAKAIRWELEKSLENFIVEKGGTYEVRLEQKFTFCL